MGDNKVQWGNCNHGVKTQNQGLYRNQKAQSSPTSPKTQNLIRGVKNDHLKTQSQRRCLIPSVTFGGLQAGVCCQTLGEGKLVICGAAVYE